MIALVCFIWSVLISPLKSESRLEADNVALRLSFPKIPSVRICALRQNQGINSRDARSPPADWHFRCQPAQARSASLKSGTFFSDIS